jgi:SPP1 gp7 family putative phage head morphogenesis protein
MGITESSNRATSEAAQFIYAQNVLMPRLHRREEAINHQIIPFFGADLVWRYDDIVPRNQEFDKAVGIDGWNAGLLTKNEAREKLGMAPAKVGGDVYKTQFSDIFVREDDDPAAISTAAANLQYLEGAPPLETGGEQDIEITDSGIPLGEESGSEGTGEGSEALEIVPSKGLTRREAKDIHIQAAQQALMEAERAQTQRFEVATMKYLREQSRRVSDALSGTTKDERSVWDILMASIPGYDAVGEEAAELNAAAWAAISEADRALLVGGFTAGLIDWPQEETVLLSIFDPLWKESYAKGAGVSAKLYNIPNVQRPELISTAKLRGGARIKGITQTTKKAISDIVAAGLEHGDSRATIAKQIEQEMQTSSSRARVIATQECNTSLLTGHYDMMKKAGAAWKTWHVSSMDAARPSHKALNGVRVPIDAKFPNGLMRPCDPDCTDPEEVINCHCFLTFDK